MEIKYIVGIQLEDGVKRISWAKKKIDMSGVKRYDVVKPKLINLSTSAKELLEYLTEHMTSDNVVHSVRYTRRAFIDNTWRTWFAYYKEEVTKQKSPLYGKDPKKLADEKKYADITVSRAFRRLNDEGILITLSRGMHMVNPEYFYKGLEKDRKVLLQKALSLKAGVKPGELSDLDFM